MTCAVAAASARHSMTSVETNAESGTDVLTALLARQRELLARRADGDVGDECRRELQSVESALGRLAFGMSGVCEMCDGDIEADRLAAHPEATLCRSCSAS